MYVMSEFGALGWSLIMRCMVSAAMACMIVLSFGRPFIRLLAKLNMGQPVRSCGPSSHYIKQGTPTMGGVLLWIAIGISSLLWADLSNRYVWAMLGVSISFAAIGFIDDYRKLRLQHSRGLSMRWKLCWQILFGIVGVGLFYVGSYPILRHSLLIPGVAVVSLGVWYPILMFFTLVGSSNAVNLTDGLDGLAISSIILVMLVFAGLAVASHHMQSAASIHVMYLPAASELSVVASACVGAGLGFLCFNAYPAKLFMGDVGSLGLGAALGSMALAFHEEILLFVMGGVFVAETLSVIIQVMYFKITGGRRIFKMSPLHHHFELSGWSESKIVSRFTLVTLGFIVLVMVLLLY